jgi:aspartate/tyrosine/aromatic aminotransferase
MFEALEEAPKDPIFGLTETFKRDPNPQKINLGVGVYQDEHGHTPVFRTVKLAEARLLEEETSKEYLDIEGSPEYAAAVQELVFGPGHEVVTSARAVTVQAPGGTGGLRVGAEFLKRVNPTAHVWVSDPTWPNHPNVFRAAGFPVETYPYFDAATNDLAFDKMLAALKAMPERDIVLLHGCCHNPTGIDPTEEQWAAIADVLAERSLLPFVDFAYQGLGNGLREDAVGVLTLSQRVPQMLIVSSFAKNFGLYNERVGALTLVAPSKETAEIALGHVKQVIRACYSNPPAHGAAIITTIVNDPQLRAEWEGEVKGMRERINRTRQLFVDRLMSNGVTRDFSFLKQQRGIFSFSGLTKEQVDALREKHSIYIVGSGRINVAGINEDNIKRLCRAIAEVLAARP